MFHPYSIHFSIFPHPILLSSLVSLLVVGGAPFPLAGVVHARRADGAGDEVGRAGGHEVGHRRRDVHPLVCHQVICRTKIMSVNTWKEMGGICTNCQLLV